jgi:archaellum component FlaC
MLKMRAEADNKEWRTHLESTKELQGSIEGKVPNTKEHLDKLSKGINGDMEQISTREKHINAQYKELVLSYQEVQDGLQKTTNDYETHNAAVSEVKDQLAQISEELEQIRSQMDERGESMTDTGPLVRIKDAMKKAPPRAPRLAPRAPLPPPAAGGTGVTARGADRLKKILRRWTCGSGRCSPAHPTALPAAAPAAGSRAGEAGVAQPAAHQDAHGHVQGAPPPPPSRTNWTRLVPPSVLTGHVQGARQQRRGRGRG